MKFRERLDKILSETPLVGYDTHNIDDADRTLIKADIALAKMYKKSDKLERAFRKSKHNWNIVIGNGTAIPRFTTMPEYGAVGDPKSVIPSKLLRSDAINLVIFSSSNRFDGNDKPDEGQHALTPWIVAHQVGEALVGPNTSSTGYTSHMAKLLIQVAKETGYYDDEDDDYIYSFDDDDEGWGEILGNINMGDMAEDMGTMASARQKDLAIGEFGQELIAQFIITGMVTLSTKFKKYEPTFNSLVSGYMDSLIGKTISVIDGYFDIT